MRYHISLTGFACLLLISVGCGGSDSVDVPPISMPTPNSITNIISKRSSVRRSILYSSSVNGGINYVGLPEKAGTFKKIQAGNDLTVEFSLDKSISSKAPVISLLVPSGGSLVAVVVTQTTDADPNYNRWKATLNVPAQTDLFADLLYDSYVTTILMINLNQDSVVSGEPLSTIVVYYPPAPAK
jgi:hypothetical protein